MLFTRTVCGTSPCRIRRVLLHSRLLRSVRPFEHASLARHKKIVSVDQKSTNRIHSSRLLGDGQVMIDVKGYRRTNPALDSWSYADFCRLSTRLITRLTDSGAFSFYMRLQRGLGSSRSPCRVGQQLSTEYPTLSGPRRRISAPPLAARTTWLFVPSQGTSPSATEKE